VKLLFSYDCLVINMSCLSLNEVDYFLSRLLRMTMLVFELSSIGLIQICDLYQMNGISNHQRERFLDLIFSIQ
jgi:hypothetical protein